MRLIGALTKQLLKDRNAYHSDLKNTISDYQYHIKEFDAIRAAKTMPGDAYGWGEYAATREKILGSLEAKVRAYVKENLLRVFVNVITDEILRSSED